MAEESGFFEFPIEGRRSFGVAVANYMPVEGFTSDTISLFDGLYNLVLTSASDNQKAWSQLHFLELALYRTL